MPDFVLTREQVREVDRRAIEDYGMTGLVLMENAGRGCTDLLCQLGVQGPVVICCGRGNNGGDGFVIARHLELRGISLRVLLWGDPQQLPSDARANFLILHKSGVSVEIFGNAPPAERLAPFLAGADWIVDALLGTGSRGAPRSPLNLVIEQLNRSRARKLAIDLPSGLDCDTGQPAEPTFRADHTGTFVAAKTGFAHPAARQVLGELHVLDIGAPKKLIDEFRS